MNSPGDRRTVDGPYLWQRKRQPDKDEMKEALKPAIDNVMELVAEGIAKQEDTKVLQVALEWALEDVDPDADSNDPDARDARALVEILKAATAASASDSLDDHRAVTAAVSALARSLVRGVLEEGRSR